jgi:hypothetical protein
MPAGLDGTCLRIATDLAAVLTDGDRLRGLPAQMERPFRESLVWQNSRNRTQ